MVTNDDLLQPLFHIRPVGQYKRWRNIDRKGKPVKHGSLASFEMHGLPLQTVTIEYKPSLGWCFYSEQHKQYFIMPTRFYAPTKVNVFHLCEVQANA